VCARLRIVKLNTTAYHPECDGMVERFNRLLKAMLRKHVSRFGTQWDQYLSGVLWVYQNTPHDTTGEKPSYLLFGVDCRSPTEAELTPPSTWNPISVTDYRELFLSLSSVRQLAVDTIQEAQKKYKAYFDCKTTAERFRLGEWVLIKFAQEESGKQRKLSRPWHGPYRIMKLTDTDITAIKIYFPEDGTIKVHQSRVSPCPAGFPVGCYWYRDKHQGPSHLPRWVALLFEEQDDISPDSQSHEQNQQSHNSSGPQSKKCSSNDNQPSRGIGATQKQQDVPASNTNVPLPFTRKTRTRNIVLPARYRDQLRCAEDEGEGLCNKALSNIY